MKLINFKKFAITVLIGVMAVYIPMEAASYVRNKKVTYEAAGVYYNGERKNLEQMQIVVDDTTYLPARAFGEMLGLSVNKNSGNKNLYITSSSDSAFSLQEQVKAKDYEIAALKHQINMLKLENPNGTIPGGEYDNETNGNDILGTELTATQRYLENMYGDYFEDIDFEYRLYLSGDRLKVDIYYDKEDEDDEFCDLYSSDKERFVKKICQAVRDRHDDIIIDGNIIYDGYRELDRYKFTYSKNDSIFYDKHYVVQESDILHAIRYINSVEVDNYTDSISINNKKVHINNSSQTIRVELGIDMSEQAKDRWNSSLGTNNDYRFKNSLRTISEQINDEVGYNVDIYVYQKEQNNSIASYNYDGRLVKYKVY